MAAPVNEFDSVLQAESPRTLSSTTAFLKLSATANVVLVAPDANGTLVPNPAIVTLVATPLNAIGTITFTTSPSVPLSVDNTGKIATLRYADMGTSSIKVTATLTTSGGLQYQDVLTVSQVSFGSLGYQGALDATRNSTTQGLLAARPTGANGDFYFATDTLTLYQKIGGTWTTASTVGANASNFTGVIGGDNLCPNSSFEVSSNGVMADGWSIYNNDTTNEPATSSMEAGRTGGKSLAVSWNPSHVSQKGIRRFGAAPQWMPGATYIVSWYARSSAISGSVGMYLAWNTLPANTVEILNPALSSTWQRYAFRITWGSSVEGGGNLYVSVAAGPGNGNVFFDDLMVNEGDVLPAYYPSAAEAMASIVAISSDNILSRGEKPAVQQQWTAIYSERSELQTRASALGVDSTAYRAKYDALESYLASLGAGFNDNTVDTTIVGATFNARFSDYYLAKTTLQGQMNAAAAATSTWTGTSGRPSDDSIKNNLIDLPFWKRGTAIPWTTNSEYNSIATVSPATGADLLLPGPKGSDDLVWYCKEQGQSVQDPGAGNGKGGGWESTGVVLDTTKVYRFVVPIRRVSGSATSYWGTDNVCQLNTATGAPNPYFANMGGLSPDRWYLFVGYIYPSGSTGNTHDNAGIWDCKTGQKVSAGTNYCMYGSGMTTVYHRAYQYYATMNAEQIFGRPMVNLVDGTEPSLREYFESGAVLNTSISVNPDGSLNGAGGGKVTLPGIGQDTYRIITMGSSASSAPPFGPGFYKNGAILYGSQRSYTLVAIYRSTGAVTWHKDYDVFGEGAQTGGAKAYDLAYDLRNLADAAGQYIVIVYTYDEPQGHRTDSGLADAMYRNGASRNVFGSSQFKYRSAYALVGISGCGEGNGAEAYQGAIDSDPNAWIDVSFSVVAGNLTSVTLNYQPKTLQDYGYTGDMNATSDITLVARGTIALSGNKAVKSANSAGNWDSDVFSTAGFANGAYATARMDAVSILMFGLNADPYSDASYSSIDYAMYPYSDGNLHPYMSGNHANGGNPIGTYAAGDILGVKYDGSRVSWTRNGIELFAVPRTDPNVLYWDSSFLLPGASLSNISLTPMTSNNWQNVGGSGKPQDNATNGATIGVNVGGQITPGNSPSLVAPLAITTAMINDLRTSNYAEDGAGNPTAGAKLASQGTAAKFANNSVQIGTVLFSDYWFRLVQAIDGSIANGRVIWRGNNDATTRGGAPNIDCLNMQFQSSQVLNSNFQQLYFGYTLTPSGYSTYTDNLDAMQQIHIQLFASAGASSPFTQFYQPAPSRTYDGASGIANGSLSWGWRFSGAGSIGTIGSQLESNGLYTGYTRVRLANTYGWSASADFAPPSGINTNMSRSTISGTTPPAGGGSGGGSGGGGGACPAPWVKVRLINGTEVEAGSLHDGARVMAVNDMTFAPIEGGGVLRDVQTIWAQRYRVKLTNGQVTEWSENHRFAVATGTWTHVQNLRPGDHILGLEECIVESVIAVGEGQAVSYRVEGAGTYFAGGMLCHNYKMLP